jgi:amino acid transporter
MSEDSFSVDGREEEATVLRRTTGHAPRRNWRAWLIGRPLSTADAPHEAIGKAIGLAVFAADALSSVAYAPQETLVILAAAGTQALGYAFPIAIAVTLLLSIVTISYRQTIFAYPNGGGAYTVARDNLGDLAALTAGASLLVDYTLLAAVATSSGVAQIVSAFPSVFPYRVEVSVGLLFLILLINLRGVRESGLAFAIPNYFFILMTFLTVGIGFIRYLTGSLGVLTDPPPIEHLISLATQPVTLFLLLRAFSNGTTALTGVECISNGVTAFKEPRSRNAALTMIWMSIILGVLFLGITFLLGQIQAVPSVEETVISQLARTVYNSRGFLYLATMIGTTIILFLATNTAFAGFPRLSALLAEDGFLPRQLTYRGSRLVYSRGIIALGLIAATLVIIFRASVTALVPLWAIGVFLSFTLSQLGMARRWWKIGRLQPGQTIQERGSTLEYQSGWVTKMAVNGFGALCTTVVTAIFAITKFSEGAWMIVIIIPGLVVIFYMIHRHYKNLAKHLSLKRDSVRSYIARHRVILPISGVHEGTITALHYARLLSNDVTAVNVSIDPAEADALRQKWEVWGEGVRLVILDSPYRLLLEPFLEYIEEVLAQRQPKEIITIVVPQFVPRRWWHNLLHAQTATWLRLALLFKPGIVITDVPYLVE